MLAHPSERKISNLEGDASKVGTQNGTTVFALTSITTEIATVLCRRRDKRSFPRAEKFGNLVTADHMVFNEGSESRNNHRYVVVGTRSRHSMGTILSMQKTKICRRQRRVYEI